jgi:hypothetical protein
MANSQKICVFDLETDGANPDICSPVQIAAIIVDPIRLEIIPDSEFNISLKPEAMESNPFNLLKVACSSPLYPASITPTELLSINSVFRIDERGKTKPTIPSGISIAIPNPYVI